MPSPLSGATASRDLFDTIAEAALRAGLLSRSDVRSIDGDWQQPPSARLCESILLRLWSVLAERHGGSEIGAVLALKVPVDRLGLLGEVLCHAESPMKAFDEVVRFSRLLNQRALIGQARSVGHLSLSYEGMRQADPDQQAGLEAGIVWSLAHLALLPRRLFGSEICPQQAILPGRRPGDMAMLRAIFGPRIDFDSGPPSLRFAITPLRSLHKTPETRLLSHLEDAAGHYLAALPACEGARDRVRALLDVDLAGRSPSLSAIARQMGLSRRSLQRALAEEGTSYIRLLDDLRRERARILLADRRQSLGAIAYRLGYTDQATFTRAARRWFGAAPRRVREARSSENKNPIPLEST